MYKKSSFLILLITSVFFIQMPSFAFYWGIFDDYQVNANDYATIKFIQNRPIKYYIGDTKQIAIPSKVNQEQALVDNLTSNLNEQQKHKELKNLIEQAFNIWPSNTKKTIQQDQREKEFKDIMPYLSNKVLLEETNNKKQADIIFRFINKDKIYEECGPHSNGCFSLDDKEIISPDISDKNGKIDPTLRQTTLHILIHEIGHYFALTDQYEDTGFDSLTHSTFNRMNTKDAVMGSSYQTALACDDVDGFVNLLDLTLYLRNKTWSNRAKDGWASFCNGKKNNKDEVFKDEFYKEAKLIDKPEYVRDLCVYRYDKNGNMIKKHCLDPLDFVNKEIIWNKYGLPNNVIDKENHLKYSYSYDFEEGYFKVFVFGTTEENKDVLYPIFRFEKAGQGDSYYWVNAKTGLDEGMVVEIDKDSCSITEPEEENSAEYINMSFDRENKLQSVRYSVPFGSKKTGIKRFYPFNITIDPKNNTCSFENLDDEILLKIVMQPVERKVLYQNNEKINKLIKNKNSSINKFIEEVDKTCKKHVSYSLVEQKRSKCNFFTSLDSYFN